VSIQNLVAGLVVAIINLRILTTLLIVCITTQVTAEEEPQLAELQSDIRHEDESVQWLPYSVSVLTGEQLEATYRRDLEEIESMVPGLIIDRMNTTPRGAAIALRGLGSSGASKGFIGTCTAHRPIRNQI
jgi:outer membrane receptor for ferrienterochelin and colicin